jgi:hypothetical protein
MFKDNPTLHLFTLKGRPEPKKNLKEIRVFRYKDGGPCMRCEIVEDMIDLSELLFEACINFDIPISDYEIMPVEEATFYLKHKSHH